MLTREQFCDLTGIKGVEALKSMLRRDQIPVGVSEGSKERGYTLFDVFAFMLADDLATAPDGNGVSRFMATEVIRDALSLIATRGPEIEGTARQFRLVPEYPSILVGRIGFGLGGNKPFCGYPAELAEMAGNGTGPLRMNLTSATAAFAVLLTRTQHRNIDVAGMWPDPSTFPTAEERSAEIDRSWAEAIAKLNAAPSGNSSD